MKRTPDLMQDIGEKGPSTKKAKTSFEIAAELETEAKRLLQISKDLRGRRKPGRKPKAAKP